MNTGHLFPLHKQNSLPENGFLLSRKSEFVFEQMMAGDHWYPRSAVTSHRLSSCSTDHHQWLQSGQYQTRCKLVTLSMFQLNCDPGESHYHATSLSLPSVACHLWLGVKYVITVRSGILSGHLKPFFLSRNICCVLNNVKCNKFRRHKVSPALYALAQGHWGLIAVVEVQQVGEVASELLLHHLVLVLRHRVPVALVELNV